MLNGIQLPKNQVNHSRHKGRNKLKKCLKDLTLLQRLQRCFR